jgi:superfamily I DNA and/or RNA helicase
MNVEAGTVHTFQGGEKRVIVFSTVYGGDDKGCFFIDRSENLMNVAVSRAQDAFLVFGSRECLSDDEGRASGLLKKYTPDVIKEDIYACP